MRRRTAVILIVAVVGTAVGAAPASGRGPGGAPAPRGDEHPYHESDTDDHPEDWQPTHDHRHVRHAIMADCSGSELHEDVICVWTPVMHPDVAGYQVWHEGPEPDHGVLLAEIDDPWQTVYWHAARPPLVGVHGYAIRAVDADGRLIDHTMPFPYRRHSRLPPPRPLVGG